MNTRAPSSAKRLAMPRPMPALPPVMSATLSASFPVIVAISCGLRRRELSMESYKWGRMLLRKENQSLPVQSGKAHDGTKTFATYEIKRDHLVLGSVEIALGPEAQPARLLKRCQAICGEHAYQPSAVGIVFPDGRDGVRRPERALASRR